MIVRRRLIVAASTLVLGLSACAGTPPAPKATGTGTAAVAPAAVTARATNKKKEESPFPGYTARNTSNGQTLYCREDGVAGTRIPKLVCSTADTLQNQSAEAKQQIDDIRETAGRGGCNPSGPTGC